jgi:tRNA (adenine57-N1/adenine58-N1)-methyltransferase
MENGLKTVQTGDIAQFIDPRGNKHIVLLTSDGKLQTNHGQLFFSDLFGLPWGSVIKSHLNKKFIIVEPSLNEIILNTKRSTTIMYPKDIGFILINMNVGCGNIVVEAGTGSGALTIALSWAVGSKGHVYSYETRENVQVLARKNLEKNGLSDRVTLKLKDIGYGFDEDGVDSLFLDLPNPENYLEIVQKALRPGGFFGTFVPTVNQVSRILESLYDYKFASIEVCEILLRYYKPVPARLRPDDRLTAHTGFLIFSRSTY